MGEQIVWVLPSDKLLAALYQAYRGEDPKDVIIDLWNERDPESARVTLRYEKEEK